jgi:hypothetical protein
VALYQGRGERAGQGAGSISTLTLGGLLIGAGPLVYLVARRVFRRPVVVASPADLA